MVLFFTHFLAKNGNDSGGEIFDLQPWGKCVSAPCGVPPAGVGLYAPNRDPQHPWKKVNEEPPSRAMSMQTIPAARHYQHESGALFTANNEPIVHDSAVTLSPDFSDIDGVV